MKRQPALRWVLAGLALLLAIPLALQATLSVVDRFSTPAAAGVHLEAAKAAEAEGRWLDALVAYREASRLLPDDPDLDAAVTRSTIHAINQDARMVTRDNAPELRHRLRVGIDQAGDGPGAVEALAALGIVETRRGDLAAAEEAWRAVLATAPDRLDALVALGAMLAANPKKADDAEPILARALALAPDNRVALLGMGRVALARGEHERAIATLERAIASGEDAEVRRVLAGALSAAGQDEAAIVQLEAALRSRPGDEASRGLLDELRGRRAGSDEGRPGEEPSEREAPAAVGDPRRHGDPKEEAAAREAALPAPARGTLEEMRAVEELTEAFANRLHEAAAALRTGDDAAVRPLLAPTVLAQPFPAEELPTAATMRWVRRGKATPEVPPREIPRDALLSSIRGWLDGFSEIEDVRLKVKASELGREPGTLHGKLQMQVLGRDRKGRRAWAKAMATFDTRRVEGELVVRELALTDLDRMVAERDLFAEVSEAAGLGRIEALAPTANRDHNIAYGAASGDLDRDGLVDLLVVSRDRLWLYLNAGDGTLREVAREAQLRDVAKTSDVTAPLLTDIDNDGDLDLFLAAYGRQRLFESRLVPDGHLTFVDITDRSGVGLSAFSLGVVAADLNGDARPDFYVPSYNDDNEARPDSWARATNGTPNLLLLSQPDGTWVDQAAAWGVRDEQWSVTAAFSDIDRDGDQDLYVANDFGGHSTLYENVGGRFEDAGLRLGLAQSGYGMGVDFGDYDNDGLLDLYLTKMSSTAGSRILARLPESAIASHPLLVSQASGNTLLRNASGRFEDVTDGAGPFKAGWAWGGRLLDIDCDGHQDLFAPNGFLSGMGLEDT